ncbi:hypothetical protein LUR56_40055 [Streptomyces sp. MT29]|nr:hypothetical protein [Streptomyces sp. MT29]
MNTQRTSWALAREAAGLILTAFGLLGVLVALGALHWVAGLSAASIGLLALALLIQPKGETLRRGNLLRAGAYTVGFGGLSFCAFVLSPELGWIVVSASTAFHGLRLISREDEGAA